MNIKFSYYYGKEADQYSFFKIPKILYTDSIFKTLSSDAKVLYAILLDRMSLSMKNGWLDEENKVFIIFTIDEIEETMNIGRNKAINIMKEIQDFGLIEKKRRGLGKPNIIYVKNFLVETEHREKEKKQETEGNIDHIENYSDTKLQEVSNVNLQKFEKQTSRNLENKPQEVSKTNCNKTNINKTKESEPDISKTTSIDKTGCKRKLKKEEGGQVEKIIKQNISYLDFMDRDSPTKETIDFIVEIMVEAVENKRDLKINQTWISYEKIRGRLLEIKKEHIEYVLSVLKENTSKITHFRAYLLSIIYNAPINIIYYNKQSTNTGNLGNYADDERIWQDFLKGK
ncbi:replication initiator protein A [Streptococcus pneumoniae]|jgi:replication initiator protein|nr:replication initiator protein A [uncultured Peptostreptococcus sp.]